MKVSVVCCVSVCCSEVSCAVGSSNGWALLGVILMHAIGQYCDLGGAAVMWLWLPVLLDR